jgi:membrane protein insertase Oxa1/YidC/SpoIIIJ
LHSSSSIEVHSITCFRFHLIAFLLFAVLVLDEALGEYQKSSSQSKKLKKTEGELREAKKKYSESAAKQHKR